MLEKLANVYLCKRQRHILQCSGHPASVVAVQEPLQGARQLGSSDHRAAGQTAGVIPCTHHTVDGGQAGEVHAAAAGYKAAVDQA